MLPPSILLFRLSKGSEPKIGFSNWTNAKTPQYLNHRQFFIQQAIEFVLKEKHCQKVFSIIFIFLPFLLSRNQISPLYRLRTEGTAGAQLLRCRSWAPHFPFKFLGSAYE
jgi:hypothetical protein